LKCYIGRKPPKLTQDAVAIAIGVSQPKVQRWLKGTHFPDSEELIKLSGLFKTTVGELLGAGSYPDLNKGGMTLHEQDHRKKEIARLDEIADNIGEQLSELRKAIKSLHS
jgi:transcriptional regulator with XRE-family HTH domain